MISRIRSVLVVGIFLGISACVSLPRHIVYDPNIKPTTKSVDALKEFLDISINGGYYDHLFCKKGRGYGESGFFAPTKYKILEKLRQSNEDNYYSNIYTAYYNNYKVRIWSSNRGGYPVVIDWSITLLFQKKWCVHYIYKK